MNFRYLAAIVLAFGTSFPSFAQEAKPGDAAAIEEPGESGHFLISGLAPDDLLNMRATASATGMMIGRLPQGVVVKNHGCVEVKRITWCKIGDLDNPKVQGWAAARYLQPTDGPPEDVGPVGEDLDEPAPDEAPAAECPTVSLPGLIATTTEMD